jgi:hypothetical protein
MKILKAFFLLCVLLLSSLTSMAYADPQAWATASLNFTLTFKDASGSVLDTSYLRTDWGLDIGYSLVPFVGSPIAVQPVDVYATSFLNGLNESRNVSQGTAFGQVGVSGVYSTGSSTMAMSSQAEVGGGLLNARSESLSYASASLYNLCFSFGEPAYLYIDYDYSIAFNTAVVGPYWWDWSAGGLVTMTLLGGGSRWNDVEQRWDWVNVYPYDDPSKEILFRVLIYSEDGKPSDSISGSGSFDPIDLYRAGLNGVGWNLTADIYTNATAPGVEGSSNTVPEPATMILLSSGLIGLAGYGRKKFFKK